MKYIAGAEKAIGLKPPQEGKTTFREQLRVDGKPVSPDSMKTPDPYQRQRDAIFEKAREAGVFKTPEELNSFREMLDTATPRKLWKMGEVYGIPPGPGRRMNYETPSGEPTGQRRTGALAASGMIPPVDLSEQFGGAATGTAAPAAATLQAEQRMVTLMEQKTTLTESSGPKPRDPFTAGVG